MAAVHDCIGSQGGLVTAPCALETAIATEGIAMLMTADGALEAVRPLDFIEILT